MDDIYPVTNVPFNLNISEMYIYSSIIVGIVLIFTISCMSPQARIYRITKRKNTDESPIINL